MYVRTGAAEVERRVRKPFAGKFCTPANKNLYNRVRDSLAVLNIHRNRFVIGVLRYI